MFEKIVVVTRKTRLEELVARFNTREQARFYIEHAGSDFSVYQIEHDTYQRAVEMVLGKISALGRVQLIERAFLPNFIFTDKDLVITIGQDGLVVNAAKYLDGQPIIAINPDPAHIDGVLLPYRMQDALTVVSEAMQEQMAVRHITMAEASLNDGQRMLAFNDLFIGVPVLLGKNGVERIIELTLMDDERKQLLASADAVRKGVEELNTFFKPT